MKANTRSLQLYEKACKLMPGGVNSPVRAFRAVGGDPLFISRGEGSKIFDVDGNEYIDYVCSWGPLILGHAHPAVVAALEKAVKAGTSYGAPIEGEVILASLIVDAVPSVERVRLVNSGTEATMSAVRLARAYTGRNKIVKFAGCYHGHADTFLVQAGSGALTMGVPSSPGVPNEVTSLTLVLPYNDVSSVERAFERYGEEIAAVIVEPVAGNMGVVPPQTGFLETLRRVTEQSGSLLIFDEVITGFRLGLGGAQERFGIKPDLTCFGKIIGGGLPVGAYGGRADIMQLVAPEGPVYQAGTLSGNPLAVHAGIATLEQLKKPGVYEELEEKGKQLAEGLRAAAENAGVAVQVNQVGSLLSVFFADRRVEDLDSALSSDQSSFRQFFLSMLDEGIYLPPSQFEAWFVSLAHTEEDLKRTVDAAERSFKKIQRRACRNGL
ncbi:MAG: glutamate-1-semialdehyde 2,1-aminomutase [Thermacetogeniaceae bacterium]